MKNELQLTISVPFEHCKDCNYLELVLDRYIQTDSGEIKHINLCKNDVICQNAVKTWNKGKRKEGI